MSYIILNDGTDRESWLEARRHVITATEVATLAHAGAAGRATLLAEKLGKGRHFGGNAYTEHGNAREGFILNWVHSEFGITPSAALIAAVDNPTYAATPDGLGPDAGAEGKTTSKPWPERSDVPARYMDQCQWGMRVSGLPRWLFAWEEHENFIPTHMEPKWFWIDRDDDRIAELEVLADSFLAEVAAPYQPTKYDDLIALYNQQRSIVKTAQADLDETDVKVRVMLAGLDSEKVVTPFGNLTWSTPKPRVTFDSTRFKTDQPDVYLQYVKESQAKPSLRITEARED